MDDERVSPDLFMYLYSSLSKNIPASVGDRLADDFFLKCNIKKRDDIAYIAEQVIPTFFNHYFRIKVKAKPFDDFYMLDFEMDLNYFIDVVNKIVGYLVDNVVVVNVSEKNGILWKIYREDDSNNIKE